jgi:hypothetical protein
MSSFLYFLDKMVEKVDEIGGKNHLCNEIVNYFHANFHYASDLPTILTYRT